MYHTWITIKNRFYLCFKFLNRYQYVCTRVCMWVWIRNGVSFNRFLNLFWYRLSYNPSIVEWWKYFPEHKGFVSTIILTGFVFSSFAWGILSWLIVNPSNLHFLNLNLGDLSPTEEIPGGLIFEAESSVTQRVPLMLRLLWLVYLLVFLISLLLIRPFEIK